MLGNHNFFFANHSRSAVSAITKNFDDSILIYWCYKKSHFDEITTYRALVKQAPRGCFNMNMLSYQYRDSYYKDKTVLWLSYLYNRNYYTWEGGLCIETGCWWLQHPHDLKNLAILLESKVQ